MATASCLEETLSPTTEAVYQFLNILPHDFATDLSSSLAALPAHSSLKLKLKINAEVCIDYPASHEAGEAKGSQIYSGSIDLHHSELQQYLQDHPTSHIAATPGVGNSATSSRCEDASTSYSQAPTGGASLGCPLTSQNPPRDHDLHQKKRKATGGLHARQASMIETPYGHAVPTSSVKPTVRQLQTNSREFPQRRKNDEVAHQLLPSSVERFVAGIWKHMFSSIELAPVPLEKPYVDTAMGSGCNIEAFRAINSLCLRATKLSKCSRSLETIIQAHWVDCFEARIKAIRAEKPLLSKTETRMSALREACAILQCPEKELRNKLSIWRGYNEIKNAGGWVCLVFAGSGIYRFCKYRAGFGKNLATRLEKLQPSLEVAADTLHPEWRSLLGIIGQESQISYPGHPHDWVVCDAGIPVPLKSTYTQWFPDFEFAHLEDSVLDETIWRDDDPRCVSDARATFCHDCGYFQSKEVSSNQCRCFPELYGSCRAPVPVQIYRARPGKNNGLIARCEFPRGSAIGEFVGLITRGKVGIDVMESGDNDKHYQIYQGKLGNYTRFINHSCAPNSQFQKFRWLGSERIILVSRGVEAGAEITVDYSPEYWDGLDKECLCGEACCRYSRKRARPT